MSSDMSNPNLDAIMALLGDLINVKKQKQKNKKRLVVLGDPSCKELVKGLVANLAARAAAGKCKYGKIIGPDELEFKYRRFPNGDPKLSIEGTYLKKFDRRRPETDVVVIIAPKPDDFWATILLLRRVVAALGGKLTVFMTFAAFLTKDREDMNGQIAIGPCMMADLWDAIRSGIMYVFEPHCIQTVAGSGRCITLSTPLIPMLLEAAIDTTAHSDVCVTFPDEGARKRFAAHIPPGCKTQTSDKTRTSEGVTATLDLSCNAHGPSEKHVIVDDMVRTGNTLKKAVDNLRKLGVPLKDIVIAVAHYDPVDPIFEVLRKAGVKVFITDTNRAKVDELMASEHADMFTVVSIMPTLVDLVLLQ